MGGQGDNRQFFQPSFCQIRQNQYSGARRLDRGNWKTFTAASTQTKPLLNVPHNILLLLTPFQFLNLLGSNGSKEKKDTKWPPTQQLQLGAVTSGDKQ